MYTLMMCVFVNSMSEIEYIVWQIKITNCSHLNYISDGPKCNLHIYNIKEGSPSHCLISIVLISKILKEY